MRRLVGLALLLLTGCVSMEQPSGPAVAPPVAAPIVSSFVAPDGTVLPLHAWEPPAPVQTQAVIAALHGFGDYGNGFALPATDWAKAGIATYAYDQRGFGASPNTGIWPGVPTLVGDAGAFVAAVSRLNPGVPVYLLGESMGGAVALVASTSPELLAPGAPKLAGVILAAPAVWARATQPWLYRAALWGGRTFIPGLVVRPPKDLPVRPSDNVEVLRALGRDKLVQKEARVDTTAGLVDLMDAAFAAGAKIRLPTLVLYGWHEQVIPWEAVRPFLATLPRAPQGPATVALYHQGWHMLLRDVNAAIPRRDVLAWIADPAAPLPSGADHVDPPREGEEPPDGPPAPELLKKP